MNDVKKRCRHHSGFPWKKNWFTTETWYECWTVYF